MAESDSGARIDRALERDRPIGKRPRRISKLACYAISYNAPMGKNSGSPARRSIHRWSLREYLGLVTIISLVVALVSTSMRLRRSEAELSVLRKQFGYLSETDPGQIAAARAPSDQPLTYRMRVRVPQDAGSFRVAYSSHWPRDATGPLWYGAVEVPPGDSMITVRILQDPRDERWKISAIVSAPIGTKRMATVLPREHVEIFKGSHEVLSTGVGRQTLAVAMDRPIRLLDERWLVGEAGLLLYGDRAPESDQIGVYAELQPDRGPL